MLHVLPLLDPGQRILNQDTQCGKQTCSFCWCISYHSRLVSTQWWNALRFKRLERAVASLFLKGTVVLVAGSIHR